MAKQKAERHQADFSGIIYEGFRLFTSTPPVNGWSSQLLPEIVRAPRVRTVVTVRLFKNVSQTLWDATYKTQTKTREFSNSNQPGYPRTRRPGPIHYLYLWQAEASINKDGTHRITVKPCSEAIYLEAAILLRRPHTGIMPKKKKKIWAHKSYLFFLKSNVLASK